MVVSETKPPPNDLEDENKPRDWPYVSVSTAPNPVQVENTTNNSGFSAETVADEGPQLDDKYVITTCSVVKVDEFDQVSTLRGKLLEMESELSKANRQLRFANVKLASQAAYTSSLKNENLELLQRVSDLADHVKFLRHISAPAPDAGALDVSLSMLRGHELDAARVCQQQTEAKVIQLEGELIKTRHELESVREEHNGTMLDYKTNLEKLNDELSKLTVLCNAKDKGIQQVEERLVMQGEMYEERLKKAVVELQKEKRSIEAITGRLTQTNDLLHQKETELSSLKNELQDEKRVLEQLKQEQTEKDDQIKFLTAEVDGLQAVAVTNNTVSGPTGAHHNYGETISITKHESIVNDLNTKHKAAMETLEEKINTLLAEQAFQPVDYEDSIVSKESESVSQVEAGLVGTSSIGTNTEHSVEGTGMNEELEKRVDTLHASFLHMVEQTKQRSFNEQQERKALEVKCNIYEDALGKQRVQLADLSERCDRLVTCKQALEHQLKLAEEQSQNMMESRSSSQGDSQYKQIASLFNRWKAKCFHLETYKDRQRYIGRLAAYETVAKAISRNESNLMFYQERMHQRSILPVQAALRGSQQVCEKLAKLRKHQDLSHKGQVDSLEQHRKELISKIRSFDESQQHLERKWRMKRDKALAQLEKKLTLAFKKQLVKVLRQRELEGSSKSTTCSLSYTHPRSSLIANASLQVLDTLATQKGHMNNENNTITNERAKVDILQKTRSALSSSMRIHQVSEVSDLSATLSRIRREALDDISALSAVSNFGRSSISNGTPMKRYLKPSLGYSWK